MKVKKEQIKKHKKFKTGKGILNTVIDKLPFEMHVPGYQYCGPGTKLSKRLARGDLGRNKLDRACMQHDIAYESKNNNVRREADKMLAKEAWKRVKSSDASIGERAAALAVTGAMKTKINLPSLGKGLKKQKKARKVPKDTKKTSVNVYKQAVNNATKALKQTSPSTIETASKIALKAAKKVVQENQDTQYKQPGVRVIQVPKVGGVLPLIPIFAGLSALGSLVGGTSAVVNAVNNTNNAKKQLAESERHNQTMETILLGKSKKGEGLYLKPYKNGLGLHHMSKTKRRNQKNLSRSYPKNVRSMK